MKNDTYWDDYEYNFFMSMDDTDKLHYIYDLMIGDFKDDYYSETNVEFGVDDENDDSDTDDGQTRRDVFASIDNLGLMSITAESESIVTSVTLNMMMNGMVLSDTQITTSDDGTCVAQYKILGNIAPISLN